MQSQTKRKTELTRPADHRWGYEFGCDGLVSYREARELLGGMSKRTFYRRIAKEVFRTGKEESRAVVCRRSLREYLSRLER